MQSASYFNWRGKAMGRADSQIPIHHPHSSSSLSIFCNLSSSSLSIFSEFYHIDIHYSMWCNQNREDNRSSSSSQLKRNPKRKLEDYLDPALLRTISSRIGITEAKEKKQMEKKDVFVSLIQSTEFDWPVDRLDPLIKNPNRDSGIEYDGSRFFSPIIPPSLSKRRWSER